MPLQATSGAASYDAFGGGAAAVPQYIEDVFQTWLYTGVGGTQTITNGIDLSGKGGLVWIKNRTSGVTNHTLVDTVRGVNQRIFSNLDNGQSSGGGGAASFLSNGFTTTDTASGNAFASWTMREQAKFFDVVTYTGTGSNTTIAHALGSVPGCIFVKRTDTTGAWQVYHRSLANTDYLVLNTTAASATGATRWNSTTATSSVFSVGTDATVNASGGTYVAYVFAHDAGGFGLTGTDNVISCGSFTTDASGDATVNLGYEPQWLVMKSTSSGQGWWEVNNMSGFVASPGTTTQYLALNTTNTESSWGSVMAPTATGFVATGLGASQLHIYIAIRRGPMKVPTSGTSVFGMSARSGTGANATVTGGQTDDAVIIKNRGSAVGDLFASRLTGTGYMETSAALAEVAAGATILQANPWDVMDGVKVGTTSTITNASANTYINYLFKRAPSCMDVVCYVGTGSATTVPHNLQAVPELMIVKSRSGRQWAIYAASQGATKYAYLSGTDAFASFLGFWNNTTPTSSVFTVGNYGDTNQNATSYIAYLFATCAGVSKVGSYTGTAALLTVNCGFTAGARFVLIKRADATGDWYTYDSTRGISSGNDPYFLMNTTAAEVTGTNYVDTDTTGFKVTAAAPAALNASGGTYIFLAIA
jgi:hypothetical protein